MAKKDYLDQIDDATNGADLSETKKQNENAENKIAMKKKCLTIIADWDTKIKLFSSEPSTRYMITAIREKMLKDGIL